MLRSKGQGDVETLAYSAVRIFAHCKQLKNFLFDGCICIARLDWWILREIRDKVDRAIFLRPSYPPFKVEKNFWVSGPLRLTTAVTD